jgi:ABC-type branched-subunit amino acid transport system permease subunit
VAAPRLGRGEIAAFGLAALLLALLPLAVGPFRVVQLTVFLIYGMLALSLDLIWGIAGILSFGQAALFGIGGYVYGVVAINTGLPLLGLLASVVAPAGVAAVLGYVSFYGRIAPMFFAVITLIVALILYQVMGSTADPRYAIGAARLGGYNGMTMIPTPGGELPFLSGAPLRPGGLLYLVGGLLLAVLAFCIALTRSSFGRILQGIRENEQRAELLGFDIRWRKTAIFTIAGAIAGLAGGLFAAWGNFINPEVFSLPQAALVVIWVLVGGRGTLYGAVLGAVAVQFLSSYLGAAGSSYTTLLLGSVLLIIVLFFKEGLAPALWRPIQRAVLNRRPSPSS